MTGARMRRCVALGLLASAACLLGLSAGAGVANAQAPDVYGWWAQTSVGAVGAPGPPDVPPDGLYIQNLPSGPSAIAALSFVLAPGTSAAGLKLVITGTPVITQPPVACLATSTFRSAHGGVWSEHPTYDCAHSVPGVVDSGQTAATFDVGTLVSPDGRLKVVILATGRTDRVAIDKPDGSSLHTAQPASSSESAGIGTTSSAGAFPSSGAGAPAPAAIPPAAPAVTTALAPRPVVAAAPSALARAAPATTPVAATKHNPLRRQLGTLIGVGLLLLSLLYWADGFGAMPLRSALARRAKAPAT